MPYRYLAFDGAGRQRQGVLDVESESVAERTLWDRGLTIVDLKRTRVPIDLALWFPTFLGPKRQDVIILTEQMANLVESGIGIVAALDLLSEEVSNKAFRGVLKRIADDLRLGSSFSEALSRHPLVFPPIYRRMVEVGERTGNIGYVLRQVAVYMEKEQGVSRKIRGATSYPLFLLVMAAAVVLIVMNFTLPPLLSLYDEFDATLPVPTKIMIGVANFLIAYRFFLFVGAALLVILIAWYITTPSGRRQLDRALIRTPIIGRINTQGAVARLSRSLSTLLGAGVSLPESLELGKDIVNNVLLSRAVERLRQETLQGHGLSEAISQSSYFPRMLTQMVRVGEETGTLDTHLGTLADFYEEEVDRSLKRLTDILEPAMIIFVGTIVAFVAISVILPMYSLLQNIR
ncbi:MAG: type II secretion system F family protein [Anaerolineales bacterium]